MKHTSVYDRGVRWVKNVGNFVNDHPLLMATGGILGGAAMYAFRHPPSLSSTASLANVMPARPPGQHINVPANAVPGATLAHVLRQPGMVQPELTRQGGVGHILAK